MTITQCEKKIHTLNFRFISFWTLIISVTLFRFVTCIFPATIAPDIERQLYTGILVRDVGWLAVANPLFDYYPHLGEMSFSKESYNYPVVALLFFYTCSLVHASVFFAKVVLTLLEALNAIIIYKITKERSLATLYWLSPLSIAWVSHEGQFEPLQNTFILLAILSLRAGSQLAPLWITIAIQTKILSIFLLPYGLYKRKYGTLKLFLDDCFLVILGLIPSILLYSIIPIYLGPLFEFNPHHWDTSTEMFQRIAYPKSLVINTRLMDYITLFVVVFAIFRKEPLINLLPIIFFMIFVKIGPAIQPWYFIILPTFFCLIQDKKTRMYFFVTWFFRII